MLLLPKLTDAFATAVDGHGAEALARIEEGRAPDDMRFRRAYLWPERMRWPETAISPARGRR